MIRGQSKVQMAFVKANIRTLLKRKLRLELLYLERNNFALLCLASWTDTIVGLISRLCTGIDMLRCLRHWRLSLGLGPLFYLGYLSRLRLLDCRV